MSRIIKIVQDHNAPFFVTWVINNICTNACSYCPSSLHAGKNHHYDWENARKFVKTLFEKYKEIHCSIAGGEPSVSPFLKDLVQLFHENGGTVGLTSNAAKTVDFWREITPYLNYISFSWHAEYIDKNFKDKVLTAMENTSTTVRVMMHPDFWEESVEAFDTYNNIDGIHCQAIRIIDWMNDPNGTHSRYTPEQDLWFNSGFDKTSENLKRNFKKQNKIHYTHKKINNQSTFYFEDGSTVTTSVPDNFINNGLTNFKGYECEIGLREIFIDWRGQIRPGNCSVGQVIGNVNYPELINWPTRPYTCNIDICHCVTDVLVNKRLT